MMMMMVLLCCCVAVRVVGLDEWLSHSGHCERRDGRLECVVWVWCGVRSGSLVPPILNGAVCWLEDRIVNIVVLEPQPAWLTSKSRLAYATLGRRYGGI